MKSKIKKIMFLLVVFSLVVCVFYFATYQQKATAPANGNVTSSEPIAHIYDIDSIGTVEGIDSETEKIYKEKFNEYQDKLTEAVEKYNQGGQKEEEKPEPDFFIEKARYAGYLGQSDWAIETLNEIFYYYDNSSVAWNNLAKIYESKKEYEKANEFYQKMIDTFGEKAFWGNYYYIATNNMILDNKEKTKEVYEKYKQFGGSDSQIEEYLAK